MERPTVFYAPVFRTRLAGNGDLVSVSLAWGYIVHTVIQTTVKFVACRFWTFFTSTLLLVGLVVRNLAAM